MIALQARRPHGADTAALPLPVQRADWPVPGGTSAELLAAWPDHDLGAFPLPRPIPMPKPKIGLLYWPGFGAARFAFGTFLIDSYTLGQIRSQLAGTNRVRLVYTDDPTDELETERVFEMYLLGVRPFVKPDDAALPTVEPDTDDAYVITLVDQRYYWRGVSGVNHTPSWRPASWTELFNALTTLLGVSYSLADAVHADYGTPGVRWTGGAMSGHSSAGLFDAAAAAVGKRVVVDKGGAVKIQGPTAAAYSDVTTFHTANADRHRWGGLIDYDDVDDGVPASVFVHVDENTETEVFLTDLAIADYGTHVGVTDYKVTAWLDTTAAADRWATDFYNWQLVPLDAAYAGIPDPVWSGYVGHYEIYHDADTAWTRLARPPFNYSGLRALSAGGDDSSFLALLVGKTYTADEFVAYSWVRVRDKLSPNPLTYDYGDTRAPVCGGPACSPAYHVRNLDLAVWPGGVAEACCAGGTPSGSTVPQSIVRMRKGAGDYYVFGEHPWEDLYRRTGETDADGEIAFLRYYDQNDATWKDGVEVRLVVAG